MMQDLRTISHAIVDGQVPAQTYKNAQYAVVRFPESRRLVVIGLTDDDVTELEGTTVTLDLLPKKMVHSKLEKILSGKKRSGQKDEKESVHRGVN